MRSAVVVIAAILVLCTAALAQEPAKVNLDVKEAPIKDVVAQLSAQAGTAIVLDPKAQGNVTISLKEATLSNALDVIAALSKTSWKKLQFAKPTDDTVKLDQVKSAIVALASMPVVGLAVEDPASKTSSVFAKGLPESPSTSGIKLPDGYSWATVYVVLAPEAEPAVAAKPESSEKIKPTANTEEGQRVAEMANMTPQERQRVYASEWAAHVNLPPEARRAMLRDRMQALFNMDPQYRDQMRQDMHSVFHDLRGRGDRGDHRRGR